jgi:hypothetical protein
LKSRKTLQDHGLPVCLIESRAGGSVKAQGTIVATALELRGFGFSDDDITMLLKNKHASFDCQKALLDTVKCFRSDTHINNPTIVKLFRGDSSSTTETLRSLGKVVEKLMNMDVEDEKRALLRIIGKNGKMIIHNSPEPCRGSIH